MTVTSQAMPDPQDIVLILPRLRPSQLVTYVRWLASRAPGESVYDLRWPGVKPSDLSLDQLDANEVVLQNH